MLSIDGLVTGLDTESIVSGMLSLQQTQIDRLGIEKQQIELEQSAFETLENNLVDVQSQIRKLSRSSGEVFESRVAISNDEEAITVAASKDVPVGVYTIRVKQLARAHQVSTQGFASPESQVAHGEFSIQVGNREARTFTIGEDNDTLEGLAAAINDSTSDVGASVINTGSDAGDAYQLLLTSRHTGESNVIQVTSLGGDPGPGTAVNFDTTVQKAKDAEIQFGSVDPDDPDPAEPIVATSETSQIEGLIEGLTLNLQKADIDKEIAITVEPDKEAIHTALQDFVDSVNTVLGFIEENSKYDTETDTPGFFLSNRDALRIQTDLRNTLGGTVRGVNSGMNRLTAIGIGFEANGQLAFDKSRLDDVIDGSNTQFTLDDVRRMFVVDAQSTRSGIEFLSATSRTEASDFKEGTTELDSIGVDIRTAAKQPNLLAATALAASTTIDATNNRLSFELDGLELDLTLANGDYTAAELADHIETAVNSHPDIGGRELIVEILDDKLSLTSIGYGALSTVGVGQAEENSVHSLLGFDGTETAKGIDVRGVFILPDGTEEEATGIGQILTGSEDGKTADLSIRVGLTSDTVVDGVDAELTITRGFAGLLEQTLQSIVDDENSDFSRIEDAFERRLEVAQGTIDRMTARFTAEEESILAEFTALELAVAELQSIGQSIGSSLASLPAVNTG